MNETALSQVGHTDLAAVAATKPQAQTGPGGALILRDFDSLARFAVTVSKSGLAPKGLQTPEAIFVAVQMGAELGLPAMTSLQNIAVINGRPSIWGDAAKGLVESSGLCESFTETLIGEDGKDNWGWRCEIKRKNRTVVREEFTVADAKRANLWGKEGPWRQYPKRMLKYRARGFAIRDTFPDLMKGLHIAEEARDTYEVIPDEPRRPIFSQVAPPAAVEDTAKPRKRGRPKKTETTEPEAEQLDVTTDYPAAVEKAFGSYGWSRFYTVADRVGLLGGCDGPPATWSDLPDNVCENLLQAQKGLQAELEVEQ